MKKALIIVLSCAILITGALVASWKSARVTAERMSAMYTEAHLVYHDSKLMPLGIGTDYRRPSWLFRYGTVVQHTYWIQIQTDLRGKLLWANFKLPMTE